MARGSTNNKIGYVGNGVTTAFSYNFPMVKDTNAVVVVTDLSGVETTQVRGTNYSITVLSGGGVVTFVTAPLSGYKVTIRRIEAITQDSDWSNGTAVSQQTFEDAVDKLTDIAVQLQEQVDRSPKFKVSSNSLNIQFPEMVARKAIRVNDAGTSLVCSANDFDTIVQDATTQANNAATSATGSATSAANSSTSATASANSATLSSQWASLVGSLVASTDYSAKEWAQGSVAQSAKLWATSLVLVDGVSYGAKKYANDAATSAAASAASAASLTMPSLTGNGTNILRVNTGGTAWELRTPAQTLTDIGGLKASNNLSDIGSATTARSNLGLVIGTNVQAYNANIAVTNANQTFSVAQRGSIIGLTDGATITPDFNTGNDFSVTLGGNRTLANPTNITVGQKGVFIITQDGTGSRTLAFGTYYKWSGGTAPTLTTTASAVDRIQYHVVDSTHIHCTWMGAFA